MQGEWNKDTFEELFQRNDAAIERAILVLYQRQTEDERMDGNTKHHNGRGFGGRDAVILSSFAERIKTGRRLTPKQMAVVRRKSEKTGFSMLAKYHRQLLEEVEARQNVQIAA